MNWTFESCFDHRKSEWYYIYYQGRHSNQSHVPWHWLFFCPAPKVSTFFGRPPHNKNSTIPKVALVDFTPNWRQCILHNQRVLSSLYSKIPGTFLRISQLSKKKGQLRKNWKVWMHLPWKQNFLQFWLLFIPLFLYWDKQTLLFKTNVLWAGKKEAVFQWGYNVHKYDP